MFQDDDPSPALALDKSGWEIANFLKKVNSVVPSSIYVFNEALQRNEFENRPFAELMGFTKAEAEDMGIRAFHDLCHPEDWPKILDFRKRMRGLPDGAMETVEYRVRHSDGRTRSLITYAAVLDRDEHGEVARSIGVTADLTDQKKAEAQAQKAFRAETAATERLRAFAYSISHELRAPTATLQMLLGELSEGHAGALSPDAQNLVDKGLQTVARMQAVTENTLDFTSLVERDTTYETLNLGTILADVTQDMEAAIVAAGALVTWGELPDLCADRHQLHALFRNLISNGLNFSRPRVPPVIKIEAEPDGEFIAIGVHDNGQGIDPKNHSNIFKMFWRGHGDEDVQGIGLGLQVCHHIIVAHGGDIWVDSTVGQGSTFWMRLPGTGA